MANEDEEEPLTPSEATNGDDKKSKIKKLALIVTPILIAILGALYFYFFIINSSQEDTELSVQKIDKKEKVVLEKNTYLDLAPMTISLLPSGPKKEHLRINITLRLLTEDEGTEVMTRSPVIRDTLITFLGSLRSKDFNSSSNVLYLKEEISKRINKIIAPIVIKEVLFQEITID